MKTYARIENQRVAEIVSLDVKPEKLYHPSLVWVDITTQPEPPDVDYRYSDGVFIAPIKDTKNAVLTASSRIASEMEEASRTIAPLQDAVDISIATDDDIIRLSEWKRYRVALSRLDPSSDLGIEWPKKPG